MGICVGDQFHLVRWTRIPKAGNRVLFGLREDVLTTAFENLGILDMSASDLDMEVIDEAGACAAQHGEGEEVIVLPMSRKDKKDSSEKAAVGPAGGGGSLSAVGPEMKERDREPALEEAGGEEIGKPEGKKRPRKE